MTLASTVLKRECSGSVVECLTRDRKAEGLSLTSVTALGSCTGHIYPSLVLVQPKKTRPCLTERLLIGRKESNQPTKQTTVLKKTLKILFKCIKGDSNSNNKNI